MNDLTDEQKSALLAKAMGWYTENMTDTVVMIDTPEGKPFFSFYNPANMALAWRVLNWAYDHSQIEDQGRHDHFIKWWREANLNTKPPADAQRLWLDKILELAVEAGIIDERAATK